MSADLVSLLRERFTDGYLTRHEFETVVKDATANEAPPLIPRCRSDLPPAAREYLDVFETTQFPHDIDQATDRKLASALAALRRS